MSPRLRTKPAVIFRDKSEACQIAHVNANGQIVVTNRCLAVRWAIGFNELKQGQFMIPLDVRRPWRVVMVLRKPGRLRGVAGPAFDNAEQAANYCTTWNETHPGFQTNSTAAAFNQLSGELASEGGAK